MTRFTGAVLAVFDEKFDFQKYGFFFAGIYRQSSACSPRGTLRAIRVRRVGARKQPEKRERKGLAGPGRPAGYTPGSSPALSGGVMATLASLLQHSALTYLEAGSLTQPTRAPIAALPAFIDDPLHRRCSRRF